LLDAAIHVVDYAPMVVRRKRSVQNGVVYEYLQIVRPYRVGGKVRQEVVATLGRAEKLMASGEVDGLLRSLAKFSEKLRVVEASRQPDIQAHESRAWGSALVFGRLWENQGVPAIIEQLSRGRKLEFDIERAASATALQRLCAPGSDLQGSQWITTVEAPGFEKLALQHFCRTALFLAEVRSELETELSWKYQDLFSEPVRVPQQGDRALLARS